MYVYNIYFDHIHSSLPSFVFIDWGKSTLCNNPRVFYFLKKMPTVYEYMFVCLSKQKPHETGHGAP